MYMMCPWIFSYSSVIKPIKLTLKWSGLCVAAALQNHMRAMHAQHTPCLLVYNRG